MNEQAPAVALLFDDTELGSQLRDALSERGARIVHEGVVSSLSSELLKQIDADVLVVNLDNSADDALDQLYELVEGDRPRLVFNDAHASRTLQGWDRARWARHLAVKVLTMGDVDPPRPQESSAVEVPPQGVSPDVITEQDPTDVILPDAFAEAPVDEVTTLPEELSFDPGDFDDHSDESVIGKRQVANESESLASELEALLASEELTEKAEPEGPGMRYFDNDALHDGNFGEPADAYAMEVENDAGAGMELTLADASMDEPVKPAAAVSPAIFQLDHLELTTMADASDTMVSAPLVESVPAASLPSVHAPDEWALLDDALPTADLTAEDSHDAAAFGIQKMSAADFLAHDIDAAAADFEPTMSLELVSMEDAIAPQAYVHEGDHEMVLDELGSALSRIVLLGAAVDGVDSVCAFLAALPASTRLTFLHTQHLGESSDIALAEKLGQHSALPVHLARQGGRAGAGEVLMVPAGQHLRLRRDGSIELQSFAHDAELDPSIDNSFTMAANAFGRDALAIVFAGRGNDAVAGAQAIHDRGGEVWVESSSGEHFADMVSGIFAERLVGFSGTSPELAAHLLEVFP